MGNDTDIINTLGTDKPFMGIRNETTLVRRRKSKRAGAISRPALIQFQISFVQSVDRIFDRQKLLHVGIIQQQNSRHRFLLQLGELTAS
jgi:hypothetical protein